MKRIVRLTGMLLMLILASNLSLSAQRGMRGTMDSTRLNRMRTGSETIHRNSHGEKMNPNRMRGHYRGGRGPADCMLASIPNVTEKQKKDISDLKQKQQDEMKKFRDDMSAKIHTMRDSHKKGMMSILTDDQKKFIESNQPNAPVPPANAK